MSEADNRVAREDARDQVDEILAQWATVRPDLDSTPMGVIGRICRLAPHLVEAQNQIFSRHNLENIEFDILTTLSRQGEPFQLTPGELAKMMGSTPSVVAQRFGRLEELELIERAHSFSDRRKVAVTLTPKGLKLIKSIIAERLDYEKKLLDGFSDEQLEVLTSVLRQFLILVGEKPLKIGIKNVAQNSSNKPAVKK